MNNWRSEEVVASGAAGELRQVIFSGERSGETWTMGGPLFEVHAMELTDSAGGEGTLIERVFANTRNMTLTTVFPTTPRKLMEPGALAAVLADFGAAYWVTIEIRFLVDCRFTARLSGRIIA